MGSDDIWGKLTDLSITCGMNQGIAQHFLTQAERWNWLISVALVASTVLCFGLTVCSGVLSLIGVPPKKIGWVWVAWWTTFLSIFTSGFASVAGLVLVFSPSNGSAIHFQNTFQAWSDLRQEVDAAIEESNLDKPFGIPTEEAEIVLRRRYGELQRRKNALNQFDKGYEIEPSVAEQFLQKEERSRGVQYKARDTGKADDEEAKTETKLSLLNSTAKER